MTDWISPSCPNTVSGLTSFTPGVSTGTRIILCWPCLRNKFKTTRNFTMTAIFTVFVKSTISQTAMLPRLLKIFETTHCCWEYATLIDVLFFTGNKVGWVCVCVCRYTADKTRKHITYHGCGCFLDLFFHEHVGLVTDQLWIRGLAPITCQSQDLTNNKCQQDWIDKSAVWTEPVGRKGWAGTLGGTPCPLTKVHFYYKSGTEWV